MARRTKGEGSIFWSRSEKTWIAKLTLPDGREKRKRSKQKSVVNDWLFEQRLAIKEHRTIPDDKITFAQFANKFLEEVAAHTLKASTYAHYEHTLYLHIIPEIGNIKLSLLNPQHIQNLYTKKLNSGLSRQTVHHIHSITRRVLNEAVKRGQLFHNPVNQVTPPKVLKKKPSVWTIEEAQTFLKAVKGHRWEGVFLIALCTGARRGEILGLSWENLNWEAGTISIEKTVLQVRGRTVISEPKTKLGRRTVSLPQVVLDNMKQKQMEAEASLTGLIFQTSNGTPISPRNLTRYFKQVITKTGLPNIRFHDLRHTAATILLQQDVHPKKVQELLGHSSIVLTLDTYSHIIPSMHSEVADKMDELFK